MKHVPKRIKRCYTEARRDAPISDTPLRYKVEQSDTFGQNCVLGMKEGFREEIGEPFRSSGFTLAGSSSP